MEPEFASAYHVGREPLWLRELVREFGFMVLKPMTIKMDNQASIKLLKPEDSMTSAKQGDIRVKFLRAFAKRGIVASLYVKSRIMMAGVLTKELLAPRLMKVRESLVFANKKITVARRARRTVRT